MDRRDPRRLGRQRREAEKLRSGTWGPSAAIALTERDGVTWQDD